MRNGFVSNSSSSSFIVAFPQNLTHKEKIVITLDAIGVKKEDFFFQAGKMIADCVVNSDRATPNEIADDYGYESWEDMVKKHEGKWEKNIVQTVSRCIEKGFQIYTGSASNESYELGENLFCEMGWETDNDDFFIWKENGF